MVASSGGSMFLKSIDVNGHMKDGEYVANLFLEAIKDVRESNVVLVIIDNASNYKAAGMIVEEKFPHIFWTPCVVHSLNLALKSICDPLEKKNHIIGDQLGIEGRDVIKLVALSLDEPVLEKISFDDGKCDIASMQQEDAAE
ncbi:hypothetical protein AAC387_Pa07g2187 [Persea americana]